MFKTTLEYPVIQGRSQGGGVLVAMTLGALEIGRRWEKDNIIIKSFWQ